MKKFINPSPIPNGGFPLFGSDMMDCLQSEIYKAIVAPYKAFNEPVIVYGAVAVEAGGAVAISAGMVFLDGELMEFPAYNGAYPVYLKQAEPTVISKLYKDQSPRPVTIQRNAEWSANQPGSGEFVKFDPYTSQYLKDVRRRHETPLGRCEWYPGIPNASAFDVNGVGKWEWKGFCFANGYGGSTNLKGRVPAGFDPSDGDFAIGNDYGTKTHTLTINQMPSHQHEVDDYGSVTAPGTHPDGKWFYADGGTGTFQGVARVKSAGGGNSHNNMQPTKFGVWLQRKD
ncbi:hypothetical protein [Pelobium manganitolerans]|uniref:hypothetical protein n=1 Tax=Pelobium manganitolerans TaxID=1842495 RepID=UPI003FA3D890